MGGAYPGDTYQSILYHNPGHGNHWLTVALGRASVSRLRPHTVHVTSIAPRPRLKLRGQPIASERRRRSRNLRSRGRPHTCRKLSPTSPPTKACHCVKGIQLSNLLLICEARDRDQ
jgi:hypothetical protein